MVLRVGTLQRRRDIKTFRGIAARCTFLSVTVELE